MTTSRKNRDGQVSLLFNFIKFSYYVNYCKEKNIFLFMLLQKHYVFIRVSQITLTCIMKIKTVENKDHYDMCYIFVGI
jgi:hypothetical protein